MATRTWNIDCLVEATKTLQEFLDGRVAIVEALGVDMAGMPPDIRSFPLANGAGGFGYTIHQPFVETIIHQPLSASFMIFDIWPEEGHFTLTIKSCVEFYAPEICKVIEDIYGRLVEVHSWMLGRS